MYTITVQDYSYTGFDEYKIAHEGIAAIRKSGKWNRAEINNDCRWMYRNTGIWL